MEKRYQVFISSTFADLEEERKGIMEAIINLDCFPAGMEMFPASDIEQFEYIKTIIDQSDYYVLVIAGRYGSTDDDGVSYTEKEFNYAIEKNIPVLVFVKQDIESIPSNRTDNDQDLKRKLIEFRERAMKNRLAKYWDDGQDLKYKVYESLTRAFKINPRVGWIRGNEITDIEMLKKLEELRVENIKLKDQNRKFRDKINESEEIKDIAQGEDELTIRYKAVMSYRGDPRNYSKNVSWNELFASVGPNFILGQNIQRSKEIVEDSLNRLNGNIYYRVSVNEDDFNTIKLQFDALDLIACSVQKTTSGGFAEFMTLTSNGKNLLQKLKLQKKEVAVSEK